MSGERFTVRAARPGDAQAVSETLSSAGVAAWGPFLGDERVRAGTAGVMHPADFVAEDREGVMGFVSFDRATGEISRLYTHPRAWGMGAGRALLDRALAELRAAGCTQAWLNTEARNERARRIYERLGWREEGEPRVRDWHGVELVEPRYVRDL